MQVTKTVYIKENSSPAKLSQMKPSRISQLKYGDNIHFRAYFSSPKTNTISSDFEGKFGSLVDAVTHNRCFKIVAFDIDTAFPTASGESTFADLLIEQFKRDAFIRTPIERITWISQQDTVNSPLLHAISESRVEGLSNLVISKDVLDPFLDFFSKPIKLESVQILLRSNMLRSTKKKKPEVDKLANAIRSGFKKGSRLESVRVLPYDRCTSAMEAKIQIFCQSVNKFIATRKKINQCFPRPLTDLNNKAFNTDSFNSPKGHKIISSLINTLSLNHSQALDTAEQKRRIKTEQDLRQKSDAIGKIIAGYLTTVDGYAAGNATRYGKKLLKEEIYPYQTVNRLRSMYQPRSNPSNGVTPLRIADAPGTAVATLNPEQSTIEGESRPTKKPRKT